MEKSVKIKVNDKLVGMVVGEKFIKRIKGSKHLLRIPPAISFDMQSLREAYLAGARRVSVLDIETGDAYFTSMLEIYAMGTIIDRGYGKQIALPIDRWRKVSAPAAPVQGSLFEGAQ